MSQHPPMTLGEVDHALAEWGERFNQIDENLLELESLPATSRVQGIGGADAFVGETRVQVAAALAAVDRLFLQRGQLTTAIERAQEIRAGLGSFRPSEQRLREITEILRGPSVQLATVQTPLAQRGLLTRASTEPQVTPDDMLEMMTQAFAGARDTLMAVEQAITALTPALDAAEGEVATLARMADAMGDDAGQELATARTLIATAREQVMRDPLGADAHVTDRLTPVLRDTRARLDALAIAREKTARDRARARDLLTQLQTAHARSVTGYERSRAEIMDAAGLVPPTAGAAIDGLADWLGTLERTIDAGRWKSAAIGLARWLREAETALTTEQAAANANEGPCAARDELLGRLLARRQQVQTLLLRGMSIDPELELQASEAESLLRRRPTPLEQAATLVAAYESRLHALLRH